MWLEYLHNCKLKMRSVKLAWPTFVRTIYVNVIIAWTPLQMSSIKLNLGKLNEKQDP